MSLSSPKRRRRQPKEVDVSSLPPIETLDPTQLKQFTKEELTAYLASKGIRAKFTKPEMKRQVRLLIQALQDNQPEIIQKLQDDGLRELVEIPSRKSSRRFANVEADGEPGPASFCIGDGCKKKANRDCEFQRCRSCCTTEGFLCYTHVNDFTRLRRSLSSEKTAGPRRKQGVRNRGLSASGPRAVTAPEGAEPHPFSKEYHKQVHHVRLVERVRSLSADGHSRGGGFVPGLSMPLPRLHFGAFFAESGDATLTPPASPGKRRGEFVVGSEGFDAEQACPSCGDRVSNIGSNFLAHLRTCDGEKSFGGVISGESASCTSGYAERLHAHAGLMDEVFGVDHMDDVMCKLGNTSISDVEKDLVAARTALSEFSSDGGALEDELKFWSADTFDEQYGRLHVESPVEFEAVHSDFSSDFHPQLDIVGSADLDDYRNFPLPQSSSLMSLTSVRDI